MIDHNTQVDAALVCDPADQPVQSELEAILQPLLDLFNEKYRAGWEEEFRFCHETAFKPLNDATCALIELPEDLDEYPEMANVLRNVVTLSEACFDPYQGRPDGEGPVCGPCRFSVQKKAYSDDGCSYVYGTHLVVERKALDAQAARRQVADLSRELRDN